MPQVIVDPDELSRFVVLLEQYLNTLNDETNNLCSGFAELGNTWQDGQRAAFEEQFNMLMTQIAQFKSSCAEQIPYLQGRIEAARIYLGGR